MNRLALLCFMFFSLTANQYAFPDNAGENNISQKVDDLEKPLYTPFVERYILDELKQIRIDMQAMRAELIEKVVQKELSVADKTMSYATDTITYFFYLIVGSTSLLVLVGWTSIRDIKEKVKAYADQEVIRLTSKYERRLKNLEEEFHKKSRKISETQDEIEKTNEIHALWLRASQESNPSSKITLYDQVLALRPDNTEALTYKADAALLLDEPQWAISLCNRALEIDPENAHAYYQRACAYAIIGHGEEALNDLKVAINLSEVLKEDAATEDNFIPIKDHQQFIDLIAK